MTKKEKLVYFFGGKKAEGKKELKALLGGKGANLAEMVNIGVPIPPGFTITTKVCNYFTEKKKYPQGFKKQYFKAIKKVEKLANKKFGKKNNP